jgi:hypothetical protein
MSKLLIALLIVSSTVQAEALFETNNKANGKIVLTDEMCRDNSHRLAYSMMPGYDTILGCWSADGSFVHVGWYDGSLRSYPYGIWTEVKRTRPNT